MSIYRCENCEEYLDSDLEGIEEHPHQELVCVCPMCYDFLHEIPIREVLNVG